MIVHITIENHHIVILFNSLLILAGLVGAILGLYEFVHFIMFGPSSGMVIPYILPPDVTSRVAGVFGQPNHFALFLNVALLGIFFQYIHLAPYNHKSLTSVLRFLPPAIIAFVLFLTTSRAGLLACIAILLFLMWLLARGYYLSGNFSAQKEFWCLTISVLSGLLFGFLLVGNYLEFLGLSIGGGVAERYQNVSGVNTGIRFMFWAIALSVFKDYPWLGIGLDNFKFVSVPYRYKAGQILGFVDFDLFRYSKWTHNEFLQILCEGGVLTILPIIALIFLFLFGFRRCILKKKSPRCLYLHLFLLPFFIQSNFSWPLRHTSLAVLFFCLVGFLLAEYSHWTIKISTFIRRSFIFLLIISFFFAGSLFYQELQIGSFYRSYPPNGDTNGKLGALEIVSNQPYAQLRVLRRAIPAYTKLALKSDTDDFARGLLPFAEQLTQLQSHEVHWLNLALLYFRVDERQKAAFSVKKAIDLRPNFSLACDFEHYLNMLTASEKTGRPIEEFFPNPPGAKYELPEIFQVRNRTQKRF
jgi:O-antigen ligase